jgi:hypothetical protein
MTTRQKIQWLSADAIDRKKWDECMASASNVLVYGHSFYLDTFAQTWSAIVLNDYEAVMPLPSRKKWGFHYLFQPFLTPMLGVFGRHPSPLLVNDFLDAIPSTYKLWDISLNSANVADKRFQQQYARKNHTLSLSSAYTFIRNNYSENITRNISKAVKAGCVVKNRIPIDDIIAICRTEWPKFTSFEPNVFEHLKNNWSSFAPFVETYGVYSADGKLLASCAFLLYSKRACYWLVGNDPAAKDTGASPLLIDQFIQDHAGKDLLFDFEGSDVNSIAEFYQRFGAKPETYTTIYNNKLPFPFNLLKRTPSHYRSLSS